MSQYMSKCSIPVYSFYFISFSTMQNSVQKVKSVRFGSGILSMSSDDGATWVNLGALKDANLNVTKSIIEVVMDNAKMPPKVKLDEVIFSANLYEIALENLQTMDGIATYTTVDASPVTVTAEANGTGWTVGTPFKLTHKDGDNTSVGSIVVKSGVTTLTLNTDYRVYVQEGYTYIFPLTSQAGAITVGYSYTPLASKEQLYKDIVKTLATNRFKFVNVDEDGKEFGIEVFEGYNRAGIDATFLPDDTTDDALNIPIEIKAYPVAGSQNMFRVYDEQDVA